MRAKVHRKNFGYPLCFFIGMLCFDLVLSCSEQKVDWDRIGTIADEYFDYPSTQNAARFYESLPAQGSVDNGPTARKVIESIFSSSNISLLERQMWTGDRNAVRVAFRLYNISDGAFTEWIDASLGDFIRVNPVMFLEELRDHLSVRRIASRAFPVVQGNLIIYKSQSAYEYELEMRIKALMSVKNQELTSIRDSCIMKIREFIKHNK